LHRTTPHGAFIANISTVAIPDGTEGDCILCHDGRRRLLAEGCLAGQTPRLNRVPLRQYAAVDGRGAAG